MYKIEKILRNYFRIRCLLIFAIAQIKIGPLQISCYPLTPPHP